MKRETFTGCDCTAGRPALVARSARANRVLHHNEKGGVLILVESRRPRIWKVLVARGDGAPWKFSSFSSVKMSSYHEAQALRGIKGALTDPSEMADVLPYSVLALARVQYRHAFEEVVLPEEIYPSFTIPEAPPEPPDEVLEEPLESKKVFEGYTPRAKKVAAGADVFHAPTPNPELYWYESERDVKSLKDFISLRLAGNVTNLMIVGPSGFGKTRGIIRYGIENNVPVHVLNCQAITTPEKWIGQMQVSPERGTFFEKANHVEWIERTHEDCKDASYCIILYDEITRLRPELANNLFSLLDDQQGLEVPQMGRRIAMSDRNVVIATANIGTPYTGAFTMDWALRGRFDYNIERPFPPQEEEAKVLTTATIPGITQTDAEAIVRVAAHTRTLWMNGELESPISTRSLVAWARYIAGGYTIKDASEYTISPLYSEDGGMESDRAKVKQAIDGKVGS